jgi:hypothetical protein
MQLLDALERDPQVERVPLTEEIYQQALELFCSRPDKEWGMIDCVSFVIMNQRGLTEALTTDEHFEQAGFKALLAQSKCVTRLSLQPLAYAVSIAATSCRPRSMIACSRILNFWILPVTVVGKLSTNFT